MQRAFRLLPAFGRSHHRFISSIPNQNGTFSVRKVRILQRAFTLGKRKRQLIGLLSFGLAWWYLTHSVTVEEEQDKNTRKRHIKQTVQQVQRATEGERVGADGGDTPELGSTVTKHGVVDSSGDEEEDEDELLSDEWPENARFFPIAWPVKQEQTYYSGSDPEWQAFVEFSKDSKRQSKVKAELAYIVVSAAGHNTSIRRYLGSPVRLTKYWLSLRYPEGPPPEYSTIGLAVTEEYVGLVEKTVDPSFVQRLRNVISPFPVLQAMWRTYVQQTKAGMRPSTGHGSESAGADHPSTDEGSDEDVTETSITPSKGSNEPHVDIASSLPNSGLPAWTRAVLQRLTSAMPYTIEDTRSTSKLFMKNLGKARSTRDSIRNLFPPPRGTILITGLVEMQGPDGSCLMDVYAAYEPRDSEWQALWAGLRIMHPKKQTPRGTG